MTAFAHEALFYADDDEFLAGTLGFIRDGMAAREPVMVAVPGPKIGALRAGLGEAGAQVGFVDMTVAGRNPGRIIPAVLLAFLDAHRTERVRLIGEPNWPARSPAEYPACVQHEALINLAFAGRRATILCPYDTRRLGATAVRDAARSHPVIVQGGDRWESADYADPAALAASCHDSLPAPPPGTAELIFDIAGVA
jgi:hypothetical protein